MIEKTMKFLKLLSKYFLFIPVSFIVGIVLIIITNIVVYAPYFARGEEVPLYASSVWSMFIMFPAWTVITCVVLFIFIFIRFRKRSFLWKLHLVLVNAVMVASPLLFVLGSLQLNLMKKDAVSSKLSQQVSVIKVSTQGIDSNLNQIDDKIEVKFDISSTLSEPLEKIRLKVGTLCVDTSNGSKQSFAVAENEEVITILPGENSHITTLKFSEGNRPADWDRPVAGIIDIFFTLRDRENAIIGQPFVKDYISTNLDMNSFEKEPVDYTKGFFCPEPKLIGN